MCAASPTGCELRASIFASACRWRLDAYRCRRSITGRELGAIDSGGNLQSMSALGGGGGGGAVSGGESSVRERSRSR